MTNVTAIIPAYNEENTIGDVLRILVESATVEEIIVVSDGSDDQTVNRASSFKQVKVIELLENRGKGGAIKAGLDHSEHDIILILDADLIGLNKNHIVALLEPVKNGTASMTTGVFEKGRPATDFAHKITPFLSGQRALRRELFENIANLNQSRFGLEIALQRYAKDQALIFIYVQLPLLSHVMKEEKRGLWKGFLCRTKMYWEIISYVAKDNTERK